MLSTIPRRGHSLPRESLLILTVILLFFPTSASAQNEQVVFSSQRLTAGQAIGQIEQQTPYGFAFDYTVFDISAPVVFSSPGLTLKEALDEMFRSTNFTYVIRSRYIIINRKPSKPVVIQLPDSVSRTGDIYRLSDIGLLDLDDDEEEEEEKIEIVYDTVLVYDKPSFAPSASSYRSPRDSYPAAARPLPRMSLRVNLLYAATTRTPNIGFEYALDGRSTVGLSVSYNPWNNVPTSVDDDDKILHWIIRPEYRRWLCERYHSHFIGADLFVAKYNISKNSIPLIFDRKYRYEGYAAGLGFNYGYHLPLSGRLGLEFNVGVGVAFLTYDRYDCRVCTTGSRKFNKIYAGPTNLGINLVYLFK